MKICGIIAEYNPFHTGHAYHIRETRRILGSDTAILCVMSGNYVQRGDAAILEKYRRARAAVRCGADLVVEMPLSAALSSAKGFAWGGVELLTRLQCVDALSFGSECGDLQVLQEAAVLLQSEELAPILRRHLVSGLSYAAAQQQALAELSPAHAALLGSANNTLGIEYLSALRALDSSITPVTVTRRGAAHDAEALRKGAYPSASALRQMILSGNADGCIPYLPEESAEELFSALKEKEAPACLSNCTDALLSHFRRVEPDVILRYADGDEGLASRLLRAIRTQTSFDAICAETQTRCYPLARIRRVLLRLYLSLDSSFAPTAEYARVLAIGPRGREILRASQDSGFPIIVKPTSERSLPAELQPRLRLDELADDLYALMQPGEAYHIAGARFRKTPYVSPKVHLDFPSTS